MGIWKSKKKIRFETEQLKVEYQNAIDLLGPYLEIEAYNEEEENIDLIGEPLPEGSFITINEETPINFTDPGFSVYGPVPMKQFIEWAKDINRGRLIKRSILIQPGSVVALISPENDESNGWIHGGESPSFQAEQEWQSRRIQVSLVKGFTPFALHILKEGYDEYNPPCCNASCYVRLSFPDHPTFEIKQEEAESLVAGFLFELVAGYNLVFIRVTHPLWDEESSVTEEAPCYEGARIRYIDTSRGLLSLYHLLADALASGIPEFQILGLVKVVEYVSATVIKKERDDRLRFLLSEPEALRPDSQFLERLATTVTESKSRYGSDKDSLKLTIVTCCEPSSLGRLAPHCLASLRKIDEKSKDGDRKAALKELAECLVDTRNEFAHSKANYNKTGKECPAAEMETLVRCSSSAAIQCIRWFASNKEEFRVCH